MTVATLVPRLTTVRVGLLLSLLTMLFGYGLGGAFGAKEAAIKSHLQSSADAVKDSVYSGDTAKLKKTVKKSWVYCKRAHLHANAMGTTAVVLCLLLALLDQRDRLRAVTAGLLGAGSLGYGLFWLLAALRAPGLGSTGAAKDTLEWLAIPSAGASIVGVALVLGLTAVAVFKKTATSTKPTGVC